MDLSLQIVRMNLRLEELIGTATPDKNGLLSSDIFKKQMQYISISNNAVRKIANFKSLYFPGFIFLGVSTTDGNIIQISVSKNGNNISTIKMKGVKIPGLILYYDNDENIYMQCKIGSDVKGIFFGASMISITNSSIPSEAVELTISD